MLPLETSDFDLVETLKIDRTFVWVVHRKTRLRRRLCHICDPL